MPVQVYHCAGAHPWTNKPILGRTIDVDSAAQEASLGNPSSYDYPSELALLREQVHNQAKFMGELVLRLVEGGALTGEALQYLLGYQYHVVEE